MTIRCGRNISYALLGARVLFALIPLSMFACSDGSDSPDTTRSTSALMADCSAPPIDPPRSLLVTDPTALAKFSLQTVLNRVVATGNASGQSGAALFQQMIDTLNAKAQGTTQGPHCDDVLTGGQPSINGFPIECPRAEGRLSSKNPFDFDDEGYAPVGIVNRFDLAPQNGSNCGQYRIVYAKHASAPLNRLFVIMEAVLPNPNPSAGIAACLPVAQFWASLSTDGDANSRATKLENFYLTGLPGFKPVVHASHYGIGIGTDTGQIRANMFSNAQWQLREFRLLQNCTGTTCTLIARNTPAQTNPFGGLFGTTNGSTAFQDAFLDRVQSLASDDINIIGMAQSEVENAGQSNEQDSTNDYKFQAANNTAFRARITQKLASIGSSLTVDNIFDRATTQSCAGCHELSSGISLGGGKTWPRSNGFTQIDESSHLSPALKEVFLPFRAQVLSNFINGQCGDGGTLQGRPVDNGHTVGGGVVGASN